jgi:hypothetical protein
LAFHEAPSWYHSFFQIGTRAAGARERASERASIGDRARGATPTLQVIDGERDSVERVLAVRGGDGDEHGDVAHGHRAQSVE